MKSIILIYLTIITLCTALPITQRRTIHTREEDLLSETDELLFDTSIDDFLDARAAEVPAELDWYSDGCTSSPDQPLGFNFQPSCQRHDFGYQNYRAQNRFDRDAKDRIDLNFKADLYNECAKRGSVGQTVCRGTANVYYQAVKMLGGLEALQKRVIRSKTWRAITHSKAQ